MQNANLIADELHKAGFRTKVVTSNCVAVSLTNRKPSTMEVETALNDIFEGIAFDVRSVNNAVLVMWE